MLGKTTLLSAYKNIIDSFNQDEFNIASLNYKNFIDNINNDDWLTSILCQYDSRFNPDFAESIGLMEIKKMIIDGDLYLRLIPCENWAFPNDFKKENYNIIKNAGIKIENPEYYEDGRFEINDLDLYQVFLSDEETLLKENIKTINRNLSGLVEIGFQPICKTAHALKNGYNLLRLPYEISGLKPCIAIFHNINPFKHLDFLNDRPQAEGSGDLLSALV